MTTLSVFDRRGKKVGTYKIDPAEFAPRINRQLLHDVVVMYQANRRQGTVKTKTRSEVSGSTRKLYRQKGTGNARAGSRRSGVRRGGGHIFARQVRDYAYRLPKKAVRLATRMAIASKLIDKSVVVIDKLSFKEPATKDMAAVLEALGLSGTTTLIATAEHDPNVYMSARNIAGLTILPVSELNALTVLTPKRMLLTQAALDVLRKRASAGGG